MEVSEAYSRKRRKHEVREHYGVMSWCILNKVEVIQKSIWVKLFSVMHPKLEIACVVIEVLYTFAKYQPEHCQHVAEVEKNNRKLNCLKGVWCPKDEFHLVPIFKHIISELVVPLASFGNVLQLLLFDKPHQFSLVEHFCPSENSNYLENEK